MKKWQSVLTQTLLWGVPIFNLWQPIIPEKVQPYVIGGLGTISILVTKKTFETNPDGTDARTAYEPPTK